ncbi:hypothetical protein FGO68_gene12210 [Halteria grandinella]|uniref:Uncharacterized protein n=1 Tax=Halteria grandinella TaxID=5974 RepID=A0A8J8NEL1_HALGN|nr:hypothetical protein FGO68_gene12210 [Halteria grandinella]
MGFRFTVGRILLGLLMILQGVLIMQTGYKEQLQTFKELRSHLNTWGEIKSFRDDSDLNLKARIALLFGAGYQDATLNMLVIVQALLMVLSGALIIANVRMGGLILTTAMLTIMATSDNPLLAVGDAQWRHNLMNMLKDGAVAGIGVLIWNRRLTIRHRKAVNGENEGRNRVQRR